MAPYCTLMAVSPPEQNRQIHDEPGYKGLNGRHAWHLEAGKKHAPLQMYRAVSIARRPRPAEDRHSNRAVNLGHSTLAAAAKELRHRRLRSPHRIWTGSCACPTNGLTALPDTCSTASRQLLNSGPVVVHASEARPTTPSAKRSQARRILSGARPLVAESSVWIPFRWRLDVTNPATEKHGPEGGDSGQNQQAKSNSRSSGF